MLEAQKEQSLETAVKESQNSKNETKECQNMPDSNNEKVCTCSKQGCAQKCACQKSLETEAAKTSVDITSTSSQEYVDPITEEYLIERNCLICHRWFLFYELWPKKDKMMNMRMGVW
ncbi:hypothetical protein J4434_08595 [Candidatus Woesearchaeota archaeon]|nr:hypothetical protein [Candidatus Woesearchaeota archaeon]